MYTKRQRCGQTERRDRYKFTRPSDIVLYAGFAVCPATALSLIMLGVAVWALWRQAAREDAELADTFAEQHAAWRTRTGRFLPVI